MNGKEIMEKKHLLLTIEYDGTCFSGWQRQPGRRTVQGELERVLSVLCGNAISIDGTGRTDAGVHALGQCATFVCGVRYPGGQAYARCQRLCWRKAG